MKTVTENQKKWAMTACLLAALTFNLSLHIKKDVASSIDLASEIPVKIQDTNAKDGIRNAKAYDIGNGEYLVKMRKLTEAGADCEKCDEEKVTVYLTTDEQNKNLEDVLAIKALRQMSKKEKPAPEADPSDDSDVADKSEVTKDDVQDIVDQRADKKFNREMNDCEDKDDALKNNKCAVRSLVRTLSDRDIKKIKEVKEYCKTAGSDKESDADRSDRRSGHQRISRDSRDGRDRRDGKTSKCQEQFQPSEKLAVDILHQEIEEQLAEIITNEPDLSSLPPYQASALRNQYKADMLAGIDNLKKLQAEVPKGYNTLRSELAAMVAKMQAIKNQKFADTLLTLARNKNPNNYQQTISSAIEEQQLMKLTTGALDSVVNPSCTLTNAASTCQAIESNYISVRDANGIYTSNYAPIRDSSIALANNSVTLTQDRIISGQLVPGRYVINPNAISGQQGPVVSGNETADFVARQNGEARTNGGRISGPGVVQQQSTPRGIVYNGQVYQAVEDATATVAAPATPVTTTSSAVTFGPEQALSPQNQALRQELRKQYARP